MTLFDKMPRAAVVYNLSPKVKILSPCSAARVGEGDHVVCYKRNVGCTTQL